MGDGFSDSSLGFQVLYNDSFTAYATTNRPDHITGRNVILTGLGALTVNTTYNFPTAI